VSAVVPDPDTAARMHAVAGTLAAAGLTARVHSTRGVLDVTARLDQPGRKQIEVICDDDLYVEVRYWNPPDATAAQVTATISGVLAAITSPS
jgi:hypothetical protein